VKPASLGALDADLGPIAEDLAARIIAIFERWALLDFIFERPAAKDMLPGRTFARTLAGAEIIGNRALTPIFL
jgi:hypothetical protein